MIGHSPEASADVHFETELFPSRGLIYPGFCNQAKIVQAGKPAGMLRASTERRLEFAAKILAVGMA